VARVRILGCLAMALPWRAGRRRPGLGNRIVAIVRRRLSSVMLAVVHILLGTVRLLEWGTRLWFGRAAGGAPSGGVVRCQPWCSGKKNNAGMDR
jgi:hypothetical protein